MSSYLIKIKSYSLSTNSPGNPTIEKQTPPTQPVFGTEDALIQISQHMGLSKSELVKDL